MTNRTDPGIKALSRIQLGKEATAGTKVNATTLWRGEGTLKDDLLVVNPVEDIGIAIDTDRAYIPFKGGTLTLQSTPATFEQVGYLCAMGIKNVSTGSSDSTGSGYVYTYPLPTSTKNSVQSYSIEAGDDRQAEFAQYGVVSNIKLSGKYKEAVMMSGTVLTRTVSPNSYTAATISSTSTVSLKDTAGGFTFSTGQRVEITGSTDTGNDKIYSIVTASTAALTFSTDTTITTFSSGSTITMEQTFTTVSIPAIEEILFDKGKLYIDEVGGTIGTSQKSNTFLSFDLDLQTGWKGQLTGDGRLDFSFAKYTKATGTLRVTFEHEGTAVAEKAKWRAKTPRLIRVKVEGGALTVAGSVYTYKTLIIDLAGVWTEFTALENDDGNDTVTGTLKFGYDSTYASSGQIVVVNELSALP